MPTTTIRLSENLKARVSTAAERAGSTTHGFILEAIAEKTDQAERLAAFHEEADQRFADLVASGKTIPWEKMRSYLQKRVTGKGARRPKARKLAR
jgi:predicted transcriptional regulator